MIYRKTSTGASPNFGHVKYGQTTARIGADKADNNAGGYVSPEKFTNHQNSSGITNNIGGDTPPRGKGV
jgi:hypothetical protein